MHIHVHARLHVHIGCYETRKNQEKHDIIKTGRKPIVESNGTVELSPQPGRHGCRVWRRQVWRCCSLGPRNSPLETCTNMHTAHSTPKNFSHNFL